MNAVIQVRAPCRLHFGMFGFGQPHRPQYGGVGMMIEPPNVDVSIVAAGEFAVTGPLADRVRQVVELIGSRWKLPSWPACGISVRSPRSHIGLGIGTQLDLAIAAGLRRFLHLTDVPVEELANAVGRGTRSAVGTHGFQHGGLIVDAGKEPGEALGKLAKRVPLPENWRFVLFCPLDRQGLAGASEAAAFARLLPVPAETTGELWAITTKSMLPALECEDCAAFGAAVYRFGQLAGECFSAVQGGPFASNEIARLVESIHEFGVSGVGQSSWGPTVFAITPSDEEAQRLAAWFRNRNRGNKYRITIASPNNSGVTID